MPVNDFLPFATGEDANVMSQADYAALPAVENGFQSGVASSQQLNKVWRQSSTVAAAIAQFICDNQPDDVLDDGNVPAFTSKLQAALIGLFGGALEDVKVGDFFITTNNLKNSADVNAHKGYGKWRRMSGGKTLVGQQYLQTGEDIPYWMFRLGATGGEYKHLMTEDELLEHNHGVDIYSGADGSEVGETPNYGSEPYEETGTIASNKTGYTGGNQPFNVVQPSLVVQYWQRMPADWVDQVGYLRVTSDSAGNNQVYDVDESDTVYFVLHCDNVPDGTEITFGLGGSVSYSMTATVSGGKAVAGPYSPPDDSTPGTHIIYIEASAPTSMPDGYTYFTYFAHP